MHLSIKRLDPKEVIFDKDGLDDFAVEDVLNDDTYAELKERAQEKLRRARSSGEASRRWMLVLYIEHRAARERGQVV